MKNRGKNIFLAGLASMALSATSAFATGGDFASTTFAASAPLTYNHATGGGAYNDGTVGKLNDITKQLEGGDFAVGDLVSFLVQIQIKPAPVDSVQTARMTLRFLADSTGQSGVAISEIVGVRVNYGSVENGDSGSGTNPGLGNFGTDSGIVDDGGSIATLVSQSLTGPLFVAGSEVVAVIDVDDLEAGETVIVRVDARIAAKPHSTPTGNLQAALDTLISLPSNDAASSGNQTIPFLRAGEIVGANEPLLRITKTVTTADGECGAGTNLLTGVTAGSQVKYSYTVVNLGTQDLLDLSVVDDNGTPCDTSDDFVVTFGSLPELGGDASITYLESGQTVTTCVLVTMNTGGTNVSTVTATGNNGLNGGNYKVLTKTASVTVVVEGYPPATIECVGNKTVSYGDSTDPSNTGTPTSNATLTYSDSIVSSSCPNVSVITRTWTASDSTHTAVTCTQTIYVQDTTAPVITTPTLSGIQLPLGSFTATVTFSASATDNVDPSPILSYTPASGSSFGPGVTAVTVVATDACGNSSTNSFNVTVYTAVGGTKFYDANANGVKDSGEAGIAGWKIRLVDSNNQVTETTTDSNGNYLFTGLTSGSFTVTEVIPTGAWTQTTASSAALNLNCPQSQNFGSIRVGAGGGLTLGYWSNKNGENSMTKTGGGMSANLSFLTGLNLRNTAGKTSNANAFDPNNYAALRTWILGANGDNMAYMLSAQLTACELNVRLNPVFDQSNVRVGGVNGAALIQAPGALCANALGFASVNSVMAEANAELAAHGLTPSASVYKVYQEKLKTILDRANNNLNFVQSAPGPVVY